MKDEATGLCELFLTALLSSYLFGRCLSSKQKYKIQKE